MAEKKQKAGKPVAVEKKRLAKFESMGFKLEENLEGVEPRLAGIKIIHAGQLFEMPEGKKIPEFTGLILGTNRTNAWWESSFDEGGAGEMPECFSYNGSIPDPDCEKQQATTCAECRWNKYGSDGKRGKACKNMRRIHVLRGDNFLPDRLTIPATSLKGFDEYMYVLSNMKRPYPTLITKFSLESKRNKDNIEYSIVIFEPGDLIDDMKQLDKISEMRTKLAEQMQRETILAEETGIPTNEETEKDPF